MLDPSSKIGFLWGGGLGDLLILRVFLQAIRNAFDRPPILMTTAFHLPQLFKELCNGIEVVIISRAPKRLPAVVRSWHKHFDFLYLGPYPTVPTLILGRLLAPHVLWRKQHRDCNVFLGEQLLADISALGFQKPKADEIFPNILPWHMQNECNPFRNEVPFLVFHPGAKLRWQTTRWPIENWHSLIRKTLKETGYSICLIGVENESQMLTSLLDPLPWHLRNRISISISWPLKKIAALIASSSGVVCHNSGILHLSTILKQKTVSITGSTAVYWRPPYQWVHNVTSGKCRLACNHYRCPVPFFRAKCILGLEVETVWQTMICHFQLEEVN
jgi:hypothetical protein